MDHQEKRAAAMQSLENAVAMKRAFEYIGDVPMPGGEFANHNLEQDYQMRYPELTVLHPLIAMGAGIGAIANKRNPMQGAIAGGTLGMFGEGAHRLSYLHNAKKTLEAGDDPTDKRYRL